MKNEKKFQGGHPSKYWLDSMLLNFSDRTRSLCDWAIQGPSKAGKKLLFVYVIQNITVFPSFPIPYCAWREFPYIHFVLSTCHKGLVRIEKSSIFNFPYVKQVWITCLLGVKKDVSIWHLSLGLNFCTHFSHKLKSHYNTQFVLIPLLFYFMQ